MLNKNGIAQRIAKEVKDGYQCTFPSLWINLDQLQKELNSDLSNQFVTVI